MKVFIFIIFLSSFLFSAVIPTSKPLLKEEQRKHFEEQKSMQKKVLKKTMPIKKLKLSKQKEKEPCINIVEITFDKSDILSSKKQKEFTKDYINQCNSITKLNNLRKKISNYFIKKGYVTSRAYIKPQKLSSKKLHISILEGKIDKLSFKSISKGLVFINSENTLLNMKDLEVGVEQFERLSSQKASIELKPSKKEGFSDIYIIGEKKTKFYNGTLSFNNYGNELNGKLQYEGNVNLENLLNINDILNLSFNSSEENNGNNDNVGNTISYAIPIERFYLKASYNKFKYNQTIKNDALRYYSKGLSKEYKLDINYKAFHNKNNRVKLNSGIKIKDNDNTINVIKWDASSYRYSHLYFSFQHQYYNELFQMYSIWQYTKGLNAFEIDNTTELNHRFEKYNLDLNITKYFESDLNFRLSTLFRGQYSPYKLFSSEQLSIGGPYSVRGFNKAGINGNTGYYIRNELSFTKNNKYLNMNPYLGFDYGYIKKEEDVSYGRITGGVFGIRFNKSFVDLDLFYSFPINDTKYTKNQTENFLGFYLTFSF